MIKHILDSSFSSFIHSGLLQAFALFRKANENAKNVRLVMIGGCRDEGDYARVQSLRDHATRLEVQDNVDFKINVPFKELKAHLGKATVGRQNEKFFVPFSCVLEMFQ